MYNFRYYIVIAFITQYILLWSTTNILCLNSNFIENFDAETKQSTKSSVGNYSSRIQLIQPDSASQVTAFTPTFKWRAVPAEGEVEYRLLIAKIDGKIVFDDWIGQDTSYTISSSNYFEDLRPYYWSVYASINNQQLKSPVWSFWIDQDMVTDLTVTDISLVNSKQNWESGDKVKIRAIIQNSGPIDAEGCYVTLFSGNINQNYFSYAAHRKTVILDTIYISDIKLNERKAVTLTGRIPYGMNHFFVRIDPAPGLKDVIFTNNYLKGIKIQTEDRILSLTGLVMIYKNYLDPEAGEKTLHQKDIAQLNQNIRNFQQYFWDHTHIVKIDIDSLHVNRQLNDEDFTFQNEKWGYFLHPDQVMRDLNQLNFSEFDYDFLFVYYSWWNSNTSWSAYSGYTLKNQKILGKNLSFLAQPVTSGNISNEKTAIHEFLHLLDILFEESGEQEFYSPHHRALYTTFQKDEDYFDWILETWQTDNWFNLKKGRSINKDEYKDKFEASTQSLASTALILSQNYPNPFNKLTTIIYKIPQDSSNLNKIRVRLSIYDILGNTIRTMVNKEQKSGTYRVYWDGTDQQGNEIASGIYFYELVSGRQRQVKKLLYLR